MAVLDTLPGIEVTIKSQGRTLPEYPDDGEWSNRRHHAPVPAEKRTSVYVECVSDAKFEVVSSIKPPYKFVNCQMLSFWIYVDGQAVGGASSRKIVDGRWKELMAASCARTGLNQVSRRAFKFASIQKVDDVESARVESDANAVARVGEILVCVCRTRDEEDYGWVANSPPVSAPGEVAEKALKGRALSHGVAFGEEQVQQRTKIPKIVNIDVDQYGNKIPIAIFRFKYRSRAALQQELIIPRSPSPDLVMSPVNSRNANDTNNSQSRDERIANLKRELDRIKSEPEVKEENPSPRGQKRRGAANDPEIIPSGKLYKTSHKSDGSILVDLTEE